MSKNESKEAPTTTGGKGAGSSEQVKSQENPSKDKTIKSKDNVYTSSKGPSIRLNEETKSSRSGSHCMTAEEPTAIVPEMPETNQESGKSPKVLVWKNLIVSVPVMSQKPLLERLKDCFKRQKEDKDSGRREVLHGVSGVAEPGEILAIMGESGAGKTTLLNVLTQRNLKSLQIQGQMTVNGEILTLSELQRMSSYVQQADLFMGSMTVKEHLIFSARMRMGRKFTDAEKLARVEELLVQMNLVKCADTEICLRFGKSVSLGEKKRLAFATEMMTDPSILFCDEPTSGLDAFMAKQVLKALRDLCKQGKTIILTIHQPSSQVYDMFDKLCLMALGEIVYLGPAKKVRGIFKKAGCPMRGRDNPAEFCIETLAHHQDETEDVRRDRVEKIQEAYNDSPMANMYKQRIHGPISERRKNMGNEDVRSGEKYAAGWFTQLLWLTVRSFRATLRDPLLLKVRFVQTILTALAVGVVYFQVKLKPTTILTYMGFMFNAIRDAVFLFLFPCVVVFTDEMPVFLRESHANIYRTDAYFLAKNLAELPQYLILPLIYSKITFWMSGMLHTAPQFFIFVLNCMTMTNVAVSVGYAAACIFGSNDVAVQMLPLFTIPIMIFGGFFVKLSTVPNYFVMFKYISWHKYAFETNMINLFYGIDQVDGCEETKCIGNGTGSTILIGSEFGTEKWYMARNFGVLITMILILRSIAMFALFMRARFMR